MVKVAPQPPTRRRFDEEPDVDETPRPLLDDPDSPAYAGLCGRCGQPHKTDKCPNVTAVVWSHHRRPA